ncbi:RNA polymerase factor sigma-54 [Deltaproteobacteria bacterium TL4]
MAMQMKLQMRLSQQLIMTPQLQQAIKLLQLSRTELEELIDQSLIENPVLEESIDIDTYPTLNEKAEDTTEKMDVVSESSSIFETVREIEKTVQSPEDIDWQQYVEFSSYQGEKRVSSSSNDEDYPSLEATLTHEKSLVEHLTWQLNMLNVEPLDYAIGLQLIGNIENDGYLTTSIRELLELDPELHEAILEQFKESPWEVPEDFDITQLDHKFVPGKKTDMVKGKKNTPPTFEENVEEEEDTSQPIEVSLEAAYFVEQVLLRIQEFDPNGVGARQLQECLLIQLRMNGMEDLLCYQIVSKDMSLLECKDLRKIARRHKQDLEHVIEAYKLIMSLEPKPGRAYVDTPSHHYIIPDVYIYKSNNEYKVALNEQGIPRLRVSNYYKNLSETMEEDGNLTKEYIQEKIKSGQWLMKSIEQRQKTIYRVTQSILKFQKDFLDKGIHYLKPLVLKDVAEDIDVHESTVSRITTNKYVHTPQGIFELKYFFTSGIDQDGGESISSKRIKEMIEQLVQNENLRSPYTDLQIADILYKRSNIRVARRTVAKYREALNILPSNKRKQLF